MEYLPFHKSQGRKVIIVDGKKADGLVLSHWRGANQDPDLQADTSTEIVLNAIEKQVPGIEIPYVTATHFDIDGFLGVWSLFNPEQALQHRELFVKMATLADFREFDPEDSDVETVLKLVCWINSEEIAGFYPPFGEADYLRECEQKIRYFLGVFGEVLAAPDQYEQGWRKEFDEVMAGLEQLRSSQTEVEHFPELGLVRVQTPSPLHYYALFQPSKGYDMVLSQYAGQRYELEYKYTTWVDLASRPVLPRIGQETLTAQFNSLEKSGHVWESQKITDTGPLLALNSNGLDKAERFAHPHQRRIFASSLLPDPFAESVLSYYRKAYSAIRPKSQWTWSEMAQIPQPQLP